MEATAIRSAVLIALITMMFSSGSQTLASHNDDESYDVEIEEYTEWMRQNSSSLRRKIDKLDEDPVETFGVPILFGVSLSDITPNFGDPRGGGTRTHEGLDMLATKGTPIITPTEAVVVRTGEGSSAGKYMYTANPGGETFVYMHLNEIADIDEGDELDRGDLIGYAGTTGNTNGVSHLHFEIRDEDGPTDPYERIAEEFTLEEKMEMLNNFFGETDEDELAEFLVETYGGLFLLAQNGDIEFPEEIAEELEKLGFGASIDDLNEDLGLGDEGNDVAVLQAYIIALDLGPKARALGSAGATGYFGPVTEAALVEYQNAFGIAPTNGRFSSVTRARMQSGERVAEASTDAAGGGVRPASPFAAITELITSDLHSSDEGPRVQILQLLLIIKQSGGASRELFTAGATGYFGPLTEAALIEYQRTSGIPETGAYDAATRAFLKENE